MTDQAKQKREELADNYTRRWSDSPMSDAEQWALGGAYKTGFDSGYSTAMSEAQGMRNDLHRH